MSEALGTIIELPDGRVGTVVYNSLDGVGIKWGEHYPDPADFENTNGSLVGPGPPDDWQWFPDAMLREPYSLATLPCVGSEYMRRDTEGGSDE